MVAALRLRLMDELKTGLARPPVHPPTALLSPVGVYATQIIRVVCLRRCHVTDAKMCVCARARALYANAFTYTQLISIH